MHHDSEACTEKLHHVHLLVHALQHRLRHLVPIDHNTCSSIICLKYSCRRQPTVDAKLRGYVFHFVYESGEAIHMCRDWHSFKWLPGMTFISGAM